MPSLREGEPVMMTPVRRVKYALRNLIYPGLDLHVRNRASLCRFWRSGPRDFLDAGSGNGYFSWLAYRSGARVVAFNMDPEQVDKAREFFIDFRGCDPARLRFEVRNLYEISGEERRFDEIICYETLEHIRRDEEVLRALAVLLRPGGVLHLCCPNKAHPRHMREVLDTQESGGHVRPGYDIDDYRRLFASVGLQMDKTAAIGPRSLYLADELLRQIRSRVGDLAALPLFPFMLPAVWLARADPPTPFSVYARAVKPAA